SVSIPEGVASIGDYTFYGCSSLSSVDIPDSVNSIGQYAFYGCSSLSSVAIPEGVESIGQSAFYGCYSLSSVDIPDSVNSIGQSAFYGCYSLSSVAIPEGVTVIGDYDYRLEVDWGASKRVVTREWTDNGPTLDRERTDEVSEEWMRDVTYILSQDPRPAYHDDPSREYKLDYAGYTITFIVDRQTVHVKKIVKI
ncbi:MAG: leucine-rich repeat protein, partial [Paludibacteraceae bacterium]|nr:leucine-rich repeat protein [Paludibacteraceae bacterium]